MRYLRLARSYARASLQQELAHRANFWISLLHSVLNLATGVVGLGVVFGQVDQVRGWSHSGALGVLGVYLTLGALRNVVVGPSLDSLTGMDGDVWTGQLDFVLLRPADTQFIATFRRWRFLALLDLTLGIAVLVVAIARLGETVAAPAAVGFVVSMLAGIATLYSLLLICTSLVFWNPGFLFSWVFDSLFQMARYPVGLYPGWVRLVLTWIVPVGIMTTVPAASLTRSLSSEMLAGSVALSIALFAGSSVFFRLALRRYASASS